MFSSLLLTWRQIHVLLSAKIVDFVYSVRSKNIFFGKTAGMKSIGDEILIIKIPNKKNHAGSTYLIANIVKIK